MNAARWHTDALKVRSRDPAVIDTYDGGGFLPPVGFMGRFEQVRRLILNAEGREVVSEATVYTLHPLQAGDRVTDPQGREWEVRQVAAMRNVRGELIQYEASL